MLLLSIRELKVRQEEHVKFGSIINLELVHISLGLLDLTWLVLHRLSQYINGMSQHCRVQTLLLI